MKNAPVLCKAFKEVMPVGVTSLFRAIRAIANCRVLSIIDITGADCSR